MNQSDNDDKISIGSGGDNQSVSCIKMPCPYCNKDFQAKSMFNHIRTKHFRDFRKSTTSKWLDEAEAGEPLRVFWDIKNDFGEDDFIQIYACLSSNKSFMSIARAKLHFKKNPADLKAHNKEIAKLRKEITKDKVKERKEEEASPERVALRIAKETNDPTMCRAIWSGILFDKQICDRIMAHCEAKEYPDTMDVDWYSGQKKTPITFGEMKSRYNEKVALMQTMIEDKNLNYADLLNLYIFFWNFWGVQITNSIPYLQEFLEFSPGSWVNERIDPWDIFHMKGKRRPLDKSVMDKYIAGVRVDF